MADDRRDKLSSHEIVVLALFRAGGAVEAVDTEDIAVRAADLSPTRFSWKKYPNQINLETVRVFLSDAKKEKNGRLVSGSGRTGWRLTKKGLEFCRSASNSERFDTQVPRGTALRKQWLQAERKRLLATSAFESFSTGGSESVTTKMAEEFFRLDEYVEGDAREGKVVRLLDAFDEDPQLSDVVRALALKVRT